MENLKKNKKAASQLQDLDDLENLQKHGRKLVSAE